MVDYYRILKVSPKASAVEIKSAYRRLARKMHPDVNAGSDTAAKDFAKIAKAYQILSNSEDRARYDTQRIKAQYASDDSVMFSDNPHARRLRKIAVQRRMDAIVDRFIENERRESIALQQTVFPVVALFMSTFFVGMLKPQFWSHSDLLGKTILLTLFGASLWHLYGRLREGFARYTYAAVQLHDSVLRDDDEEKPFSQITAIMFLVIGVGISLAIGYGVGAHLEWMIMNMVPNFFSPYLQVELIFYPPIAVFLVDTVHYLANKADL
ncbi:MAG: J domain-containing protein [Pyrinomonadaceae bacterium]